ncbi:hypothetical protein AB0L05_22100 [Nonomuraea pusilla]|uniref:hypothetical protein n=1 Tax=Nonomuraea pusilla TaxID=46177 RepID=UPI00332C0996
MKRIIAGLALTTAAALATAAPAQAAPADPVKALKKQFSAGHGVRVSETSRTSMKGESLMTMKTSATLAFGAKGVVASDVRNRSAKKDAFASIFTPERAITVGGYQYAKGGLFSEELPEGKKWVRYPGGEPSGTYNQVLDIFRPKVLDALVTRAKTAKGGTYSGVISYKDIAKLYGQKPDKLLGKIKVKYALGVNAKGLVTRLTTDWALDFGVLGKVRSQTETRYTGWGSKVTVKAPPKSEWIDIAELGPDAEVPKEIPDNSINSLGAIK